MYSTSIYTDALTDEQLQALVDYWYGTAKTVRRSWYHHIDFHGGKTSAISAVDADATSYSHRDKLLLHNFYDRVDVTEEYPADGFDLFSGFIDAIVGDGDRLDYGVYFNYPDPEMDQETAQARYWGTALPKLQEIKAAVDPNEVFYLPQSVKPAGGSAGEPEVEEPEEPIESESPEPAEPDSPEETPEEEPEEEPETPSDDEGSEEPAEPIETETPEEDGGGDGEGSEEPAEPVETEAPEEVVDEEE